MKETKENTSKTTKKDYKIEKEYKPVTYTLEEFRKIHKNGNNA